MSLGSSGYLPLATLACHFLDLRPNSARAAGRRDTAQAPHGGCRRGDPAGGRGGGIRCFRLALYSLTIIAVLVGLLARAKSVHAVERDKVVLLVPASNCSISRRYASMVFAV